MPCDISRKVRIRLRRAAVLTFLLAGTLSCSPAQVRQWMRWHRHDPVAAEQWAANECGALCSDDWDHDGVVEPEPASDDAAAPSPDSADWDGDGVVEPEPTGSDETGSGDQPDHAGEQDNPPTLGGSCSEWSDDALRVGWTAEQWSTLSYIMARESGCNPSAYNASGASGLLQIMPMWAGPCGGGSLFDPWFNLSCGLYVYGQQGWGAWSTY
jgi:hypothetical protein